MRLDLLTASVCGLKKAKARALIDTGTVTVDGVVCTSYGQVGHLIDSLFWFFSFGGARSLSLDGNVHLIYTTPRSKLCCCRYQVILGGVEEVAVAGKVLAALGLHRVSVASQQPFLRARWRLTQAGGS